MEREQIFDYLSEDPTEEIPLVLKNMLVGIILPDERILKTAYSPQVELTSLSRVTHDPRLSILVAVGQAVNKMMFCQYFRCREVKTIPLNFSAS